MIVTWRTRLHHTLRLPRHAFRNAALLGLWTGTIAYVVISLS